MNVSHFQSVHLVKHFGNKNQITFLLQHLWYKQKQGKSFDFKCKSNHRIKKNITIA